MTSTGLPSPGHGTPPKRGEWFTSFRSTLFSLKPLGLGTGNRESLNSYFLRLADAHGLSPRVLASELIGPAMGVIQPEGKWAAFRLWKEACFNGSGQVPATWAAALGRLTSVQHLEWHSLLPLAGLVPDRNLTAKSNRWCPACLKEDEAHGTPYGRLLWSIAAVEACPTHRILLVSECGCGQTSASQPWQSKSLPHVCAHCGGDLAHCSGAVRLPAEAWQVERARLISEFLGSVAFDPRYPPIPNGGVARFLWRAVEAFGGNASKLADGFGLGKSGFCDWLNERHMPSFHQIVLLAQGFSCSILNVLAGDAHLAKAPKVGCVPKKAPRKRPAKRDWSAIQAYLAELLAKDPGPEGPPSPSEVGRHLGVDPSLLYRHCPDEQEALAKRRADWEVRNRAEVLTARTTLIREAAFKLAAEGTSPSWKDVKYALAGKVHIVAPELRLACRKAICEARNQMGE